MPDDDATERLPLHPRDFHILLTLLDGPRHGYGIVKQIDTRTAGAVRLDPANLYRAIQRLLEDGLVVETEPPVDDTDRRRRRYYAITGLGRHTLAAEAERMRRLADAVDAKQPLPSSAEP